MQPRHLLLTSTVRSRVKPHTHTQCDDGPGIMANQEVSVQAAASFHVGE